MLKIYFNRKRSFFFKAAIGFTFFAGIIFLLLTHGNRIPDVIVESKNITDIFNYIEPNEHNAQTLVIFDLDNTLMHPDKHLGSDQWFYQRVAYFEAQGMKHQDAINATLPRYFQVMYYVWMQPVQENTVQVVHQLQNKKVTTIALTARSLDIAYRTIEQLDHIGITFDGKGPVKCPITYQRDNKKPAMYLHGIIFCGDHDKGEVIADWFNRIKYYPKKIIFIDDKMKNIVSVEKALHKRDYPFIGIRYGYLDDHIKTITPEIIDKEFEEFMLRYPESRPITQLTPSL